MSSLDPTQRFSDRVENYVRYRPGYPAGVLELMRHDMGLISASVVADVGSGTGISARLFLGNGNTVLGIEPNRDMREAAERELATIQKFHSVNGQAEATTLSDHSVDFVVSFQAFHWFDRPRARREFARILRPGGSVVLAWNDRRTQSTAFLRDYEQLILKYSSDYQAVRHEHVTADVIGELFGPNGFNTARFDNEQVLDFGSLKGRFLSSSYVPNSSTPQFGEMMSELSGLFDRHAVDGTVRFDYDTRVYYGPLS